MKRIFVQVSQDFKDFRDNMSKEREFGPFKHNSEAVCDEILAGFKRSKMSKSEMLQQEQEKRQSQR